MDFGRIVDVLVKESGKPKVEILDLIADKKEELSGLISDLGAAHIIANELGVKLFSSAGDSKKLNELADGMQMVTVNGRVTRVYEPREFMREERKGAVGNFVIEDETAAIRVTLWNEMCQHLERINPGVVVSIRGGYVRKNAMMDRNEIHLNSRSQIVIDPEGVTVGDSMQRRSIKDIVDEVMKTEMMGTIVNVFNPTFFEVCPQCTKRIRPDNGTFACAEHGIVQPRINFVINFVLDDGTGTMRITCFREQAVQLMPDMGLLQNDPGQLEQRKNELLGKMVIVQGRVKKNQMSQNLECTSQLINLNVNIDNELKKISA